MSGSKLMVTGAAHGRGIYATSSLSTASSYAGSHYYNYNNNNNKTPASSGEPTSWAHAGNVQTSSVVLVIECIKKKGFAKSKDWTMTVINDERCLMLRYILILPANVPAPPAKDGVNMDHSYNIPFMTQYYSYIDHLEKQEKKMKALSIKESLIEWKKRQMIFD